MRFYRALLHLYPASFRGEYAEEMCAIFARRRREASGAFGAPALWLETILEIIGNAAAAHRDILRQDLRYAARTLARTPGFMITAILVVALGVGANTASFSLADHVLVRPLPFPDADRLVKLWERVPQYSRMELSPANYRDWRRMSASFEDMSAFNSFDSVNLAGAGEPERIEDCTATASLFPLLRAQPLIGRLFTEADEREGAPRTLILGYALWQARFGRDSGVLGRKVLLDNAPYTVIGVMPRDFYFPSRDTELWRPAQFRPQDFEERDNNYLQVLAKLKRGVSIEAARSEMNLIAARLERQFPKENLHVRANVIRLRDELSQQSRLLLIALCGAAACVLLITCANLANLLLARSLARRRELAVRTALGAGRERLTRQLVTESLVLALMGGALGVLAAVAALPLLARLVPNALPVAETPAVDLRVLGFAGLITVVTGLIFGVIPGLRFSSGVDLSALREGSRTGGGRKARLRSALVIAEVAVSVVLLISAGLLMRALWKIRGIDPGFRSDGVLTMRTELPFPGYEKTARRAGFYSRVLSGIRTLPGVSDAAYISGLPMVWRGGIWKVAIGGKTDESAASYTASMRFVTPGFFAALRIPLLAGRDVSESDTVQRSFVAVVSDSFARRYWPGENPLGRHFQFALHDREVVGVVGHVRVRGLERESEPQVYLPYKQVEDGWFIGYTPKDLVIRSSMPAAPLAPEVRRIIRAADPGQPISNVRMLADIVQAETAPRSDQLRVLGAFAAIAFLLAGIGIHGVLSFAVSQRAPEIGIRIALGAQSSRILAMVLRQGIFLAVAGVLPGLAMAWAAGRMLRTLLAGVEPGDAATFLAAASLCLWMTLAGSLLPALRAVRVDPVSAIRAE